MLLSGGGIAAALPGSGGLLLWKMSELKRIWKAWVIVLEAEKNRWIRILQIGNLASGGDPQQQLSREIMAALPEAGKFGYHAIFDEMDSRRIDDYVARLSAKQVLVIPDWVWRHRGGVRRAVIDQLTI